MVLWWLDWRSLQSSSIECLMSCVTENDSCACQRIKLAITIAVGALISWGSRERSGEFRWKLIVLCRTSKRGSQQKVDTIYQTRCSDGLANDCRWTGFPEPNACKLWHQFGGDWTSSCMGDTQWLESDGVMDWVVNRLAGSKTLISRTTPPTF